MNVRPGTKVQVRSATGDWLERIATSGMEPGDTFPIIWVAKEKDWDEAQLHGTDPDSVPWPADAVVVGTEADAR